MDSSESDIKKTYLMNLIFKIVLVPLRAASKVIYKVSKIFVKHSLMPYNFSILPDSVIWPDELCGTFQSILKSVLRT